MRAGVGVQPAIIHVDLRGSWARIKAMRRQELAALQDEGAFRSSTVPRDSIGFGGAGGKLAGGRLGPNRQEPPALITMQKTPGER